MSSEGSRPEVQAQHARTTQIRMTAPPRALVMLGDILFQSANRSFGAPLLDSAALITRSRHCRAGHRLCAPSGLQYPLSHFEEVLRSIDAERQIFITCYDLGVARHASRPIFSHLPMAFGMHDQECAFTTAGKEAIPPRSEIYGVPHSTSEKQEKRI